MPLVVCNHLSYLHGLRPLLFLLCSNGTWSHLHDCIALRIYYMGISAFAYAPRRMHDSQYGAPCSGVEPPLVLIQRSLLISFLFCILLVTVGVVPDHLGVSQTPPDEKDSAVDMIELQ